MVKCFGIESHSCFDENIRNLGDVNELWIFWHVPTAFAIELIAELKGTSVRLFHCLCFQCTTRINSCWGSFQGKPIWTCHNLINSNNYIISSRLFTFTSNSYNFFLQRLYQQLPQFCCSYFCNDGFKSRPFPFFRCCSRKKLLSSCKGASSALNLST